MKKIFKFALRVVVFLGIVSAAGFLLMSPFEKVVFLDRKSVYVNGLCLRDIEVSEDAFWRLRCLLREDWEMIGGVGESSFGFMT